MSIKVTKESCEDGLSHTLSVEGVDYDKFTVSKSLSETPLNGGGGESLADCILRVRTSMLKEALANE